MKRVQCGSCGQLFVVDPKKKQQATGLRCPHCLTSVVTSNVRAIESYVPGLAPEAQKKKPIENSGEVTKRRLTWSVLGPLFAVVCLGLLAFVLISGYPFGPERELNPGTESVQR